MRYGRKLTKKQLAQKVLYFAYGSNMHQPRLEERVGEVKCLGPYTLQEYKLTFDVGSYSGCFANVERVDGESCEGVIYELTYGQLRMLDHYEGLYTREYAMYEGRKLHFYISCHKARGRTLLSMEYYALLMLGATEHKLEKSLEIVKQYKPSAKLVVWERLRIYASDSDV